MVAPLSGIRVVDLGTMITAPLAAMMLGDLGADVIKIEREEGGDPFRNFNGSLYSPHFVSFNRNKKSRVLNLQSEEGRAAILELVDDADVIIDNFRPGVLDRLKLNTDTLQSRNPRIIHCSITGFGSVGPYKDRPAYDTVGQALSGITGLSIDPEVPRMSGTTISDNVTGMYACYGILAALFERQSTNKGRKVEVNMLEASVAFMPDAFMNLEMMGLKNGPYTRVSFSQAYVVRCADQKLLAIHLSSQEKFWTGLLAALDAADLGKDIRFSTRHARTENYLALGEELKQRFLGRARVDWIDRLEQQDVPFAPVHRTDDVLADPQLEALGTLRETRLADGSMARCVQAPVLFDGQRLENWAAAPLYPPQPASFRDIHAPARKLRASDG